MVRIPVRIIDIAVLMAAANWAQWRRDFEHRGHVSSLPVLRDRARHTAFLQQYGVLRGVPDRVRERMRMRLPTMPEFKQAFHDCTGQSLDNLVSCFPRQFKWGYGNKKSMGEELSYASKLASFARPSCFVAWDRFARIGASRLMAEQIRQEQGGFTDYASYLWNVNKLWEGEVGHQIRERQRGHWRNRLPPVPADKPRFGKRILDHVMMIAGGRWKATVGPLHIGKDSAP